MRLTIDTESQELICEDGGKTRTLPLYSDEAFEQISHQWLKVGWNQKYTYTFTWMGRPIIQLPDDMLRTQEVIYRIKPDVIIETGIAHGGSLIFYASLFQAIGHGHVIGVDVEIRPHNREAIESHELFDRMTLIEGDSIGPATLNKVRQLVKPTDRVLVFLDSCHTHAHVAAELEHYHTFVTAGSYIVATDGCMRDVADTPRGQADWDTDNPARAAEEFVTSHPDFTIEQPAWPFNESSLQHNVTHWPSAWLKRVANP